MRCEYEHHQRLCTDACRLSACAPRDRRSGVRQRRHWWCACCPACCFNFPCCDAVVHLTVCSWPYFTSPFFTFLVAIFNVFFAVLEVFCLQTLMSSGRDFDTDCPLALGFRETRHRWLRSSQCSTIVDEFRSSMQ